MEENVISIGTDLKKEEESNEKRAQIDLWIEEAWNKIESKEQLTEEDKKISQAVIVKYQFKYGPQWIFQNQGQVGNNLAFILGWVKARETQATGGKDGGNKDL